MAVPPPPLAPPPLLSAPVAPSVTSTGGWKPPVIQPPVRSAAELAEDVAAAVEKRFSDATAEVQDDQIWLNAFRPVQPILQDGPMCGLVALSMAASALAPGWLVDVSNGDRDLPQSVDEGTAALLASARERGFSRNGEMFSAEWLACLARECCGLRAECCDADTLTKPDKLASRLLAGQLLLVPFDIDKDGTPFSAGGRKAHWALIIGVLEAHVPACGIWARCPDAVTSTCGERRRDVSIGESSCSGDVCIGGRGNAGGVTIGAGTGGGGGDVVIGGGDVVIGGGDVVIGGGGSGSVTIGGDSAIAGSGGHVCVGRIASAADNVGTGAVIQPSSLCSCSGSDAPGQRPHATYVTSRHGKSRRVAVWCLSDLAASNAQLSEVGPEAMAGRLYACPAAGLRDGLCGKVAWLSSRT